MRGCIGIEGDNAGRSVSVHRLLKEPFGCRNIPFCCEQEIHRATLLINGTIEVRPATLHLYIGLVAAPRSANRPGVPAPAFLEYRDIPLHPAKNRRWCEFDPALAHHIHTIA